MHISVQVDAQFLNATKYCNEICRICGL